MQNLNTKPNHHQSKPVGIFDSGIGGLTVAHAITNLLPQENIVYLGDTAHTPWGDKSVSAIKHYAQKICNLLVKEMDCKIVVVACNTASAIAMDIIKKEIGEHTTVINVIDPVVESLSKYSSKNVGIIGTKQTIKSKAYQDRIAQLGLDINVNALATPLLVPLIEEGFFDKSATKLILDEYLNSISLQSIQALVLGCTHYPLLKSQIQSFYQDKGNIDILDSTFLTAEKVKDRLESLGLLNTSNNQACKKFFVSDYNEFFAKTAKMFFEDDIILEEYALWG